MANRNDKLHDQKAPIDISSNIILAKRNAEISTNMLEKGVAD